MAYRWKAHEAAFAMPIRVGTADHWQIIKPTAAWQILRAPIKKDEFQIPTDLYYVWVAR